jgi:hypothetical protein
MEECRRRRIVVPLPGALELLPAPVKQLPAPSCKCNLIERRPICYAKVRFALDSPLEGTGFEPSVPRSRGDERRREVRSARISDRVPSNPADICIYGGAAGGGKTIGLIPEPLRHVGRIAKFTAVFFRRTTPDHHSRSVTG